jgi:hypothetical protein
MDFYSYGAEMNTPIEKMTNEWIEGGFDSVKDLIDLRDEVLKLNKFIKIYQQMIIDLLKVNEELINKSLGE